MVCMGRLRARSREGVGQARAFALYGGDPSPVMYTRLRGALKFTGSVLLVSSLLQKAGCEVGRPFRSRF